MANEQLTVRCPGCYQLYYIPPASIAAIGEHIRKHEGYEDVEDSQVMEWQERD